jgi:putative FmdB family regulatory protein
MPTYQYRCTECGGELEVVQKFSDPSLTDCPTCAGALRKVFNAVGVVFKGSGFYRNDSRSSGGDTVTAEKSETTNDTPAPDGKNGKDKSKESATKDASAADSKTSTSKAAKDATSGTPANGSPSTASKTPTG